MASSSEETLTLKMAEGITGFNLDTFLIGIEGWRRGLTLRYYGEINWYSDIHTQGKKLIGRSYSLASGDKIHYFNQSRGDLVSNEAVKIAQSKQKTKECLIKNNVPTMPSIEFEKENTDEEIITAAKGIGFPVIIKPTYGSLSKGVVLDIKDEQELADSLNLVRNKLGYGNVIIERYFEGDDIRLYVIDNKVVAGLRRLPASVTGDGEHSIRELIDIKNKSREHNPYLAARPININDEVHDVLRKNNYALDDVLEDGKKILVKYKSTMSNGVDLYDITDTVPDNIKQIAINALNSLPNIIHGSIDMLYNGEEAIVLEINASANISMHMFPTEGESRNIGAFLMDFYFPETREKSGKQQNMYFDFVHVVEMLKRNYTNFIEIKPLPEKPVKAKKVIVSGKVQKVGYRNWVRRQATLYNLHGNIRNLDNGDVEIIVASDDMDQMDEFIKKCKKGSKKAKVKQIKTLDWNKEIKMGFELVGKLAKATSQNKKSDKSTSKEYNKLKKQYNELLKEKKELEKSYRNLRNSKSWRITKPLRGVSKIIKR